MFRMVASIECINQNVGVHRKELCSVLKDVSVCNVVVHRISRAPCCLLRRFVNHGVVLYPDGLYAFYLKV